jgi:Rad3-related DNA helicase
LKQFYEDAKESMNIKLMQHYENLLMKYVNFMVEVVGDPSGWVVEYKSEGDEDIVLAKPIFARRAAEKLLFAHADVVVFLSATILNAAIFASNLGIKKDEYSAYRIGSNFPIEKRPIILDYAGKFTGGKDKQREWIQPLTRKVEEIARRFPNDRGIIHTHSFGIQKGIFENVAPDVKKRLLEQHGYATKSEMLEKHARTPGSILIAPAMHEGIDLKDDLSRFQILCKVPYANYYENAQLMARMELDPPYYDYITIMKIVQSVGRSVRSETDWAYTYIIDEAFDRIYRNNNSFPLWFKEAVTKDLKSRINGST